MLMQRLLPILISLILLVVYACKTPASGNSTITGDNSMNSLDWDGIYSGILLCADCEGIATTIRLMKDKTYTITRSYLGRSNESTTNAGTFEWDAVGSSIRLSGEEPGRYKVGENRLIHLDRDGKPITGELAAKYVLTKDLSGITEKYWKLVELNGKPVTVTDEMRKEPHLILRAAGSRVTGHAGCNSFMGSYELKPNNRISFSKIAGTLMACTNLETETAFTRVLEMADSYNFTGDTLILNRARMAPLARFVAVDLK